MRVFVIGATGYVGSAIAKALKDRGHEVLGSARTDDASRKLREAEVEPATSDVTQPQSLVAPAQRADGVVYAVQYNGSDGAQVEGAALSTLVDALGSGKVFVYTSGVWIYGNTGERIADENAALDPTPLVEHRPQLERVVLDGVARGVRAVVIRPAAVYGHGGGIPAMWVQSASATGAARFVGDGRNHWPMVHADDLAQLYVLALESAASGTIYNAADETWFTVAEMAEAASHGAGRNGKVVSWPLEEARNTLGAFADALALDSRVSSKRAQTQLGWRTRAATALDDLRTGSYAMQAGGHQPGA
ncbi:MAG: NAD-dependent epimerase/dehydratase family protein [Candidatus Tumulicola sp.]